MTEFFKTRMGQIFYEVTVPKIAKSLESIAKALEGIELKMDLQPDLVLTRRDNSPNDTRMEDLRALLNRAANLIATPPEYVNYNSDHRQRIIKELTDAAKELK